VPVCRWRLEVPEPRGLERVAAGRSGHRARQGLVVDTGALVIPVALREELLRLAREGEPDEVCGILGGHALSAHRVFPVRNTAEDVDASHDVFRDRQTGVATAGRRP